MDARPDSRRSTASVLTLMNVKMVHIHVGKVKNVEIVPVRTLSDDKKNRVN